MEDNLQLALARLLVSRLERLSADSLWAHRASGLRGSLLRHLEGDGEDQCGLLDPLIQMGFEILEEAAKELNKK
jgi:hypothetical protein